MVLARQLISQLRSRVAAALASGLLLTSLPGNSSLQAQQSPADQRTEQRVNQRTKVRDDNRTDPAAGPTAAQQQAAARLRRDWLKSQLPKLIRDERELAQVLQRVETVNDDEVQELSNLCLAELEARRRLMLQGLRSANARERAFRDELARAATRHVYAAPPVGYFPIIGWFPEGVQMSAQAVVSPDRRSVRMSLNPFFSSVGPVYTFNYMTGETRRLTQFDPPPPLTITPPATLPDISGR